MEKFNPEECTDEEIERFTLRLSHKQKEQLTAIAQDKNISLNLLITRCIDFALRNM